MAAPASPPAAATSRPGRARVREAVAVAGNALRTMAMVAKVDRRLLIVLLLLQALDALSVVAVAYVGKEIIDAVVAAARAPEHPLGATLGWVAVEFALMAGHALIGRAIDYASIALRSKLGVHVNLVILEKAANVSYERFEDPEFMNRMTQARREASVRPIDLVQQILVVVRQGITLGGFAALLSSLGAWAIVALLLTALPPFFAEAYYGRALFHLQRARTMRNRQTFYLELVLTSEQSVKEVKLFALGRWLIDRYRQIHLGFQREELALAWRRNGVGFAAGMVSVAALYGAYAFIALRTVAGALSLGTMALYVTVFRQGQQSLQGALSAVARIYEDNLFMTNLFEYLAVESGEPHVDLDPAAAPAAPPRIVLEHVTYRYPGAARDALHDVSLCIEPGEAIGLVGRNGAGKTTLVKLLVGLYRPSAGRILIDGVDARELGPAALRQRIGVIFQDFTRFQFSAADNIGVGWLPSLDDRAAITRAVEEGGAGEVIDRLPRGLDTPLGRAFGGDDVSMGQWQRIALARAFMRKSRILVLDEPTAALDAEAEHEIFSRFRELRAGRTAILITHRFSTVRMADRIVVFEDGHVVEQGTHAALLATPDGRYARMFRLQAEGYEMEAAPAPGDLRAPGAAP